MRRVDQIAVAYRDTFRDYLYGHWNVVWTIYILFLIGIVVASYYLIFFKKSEHQIKLTLRLIAILNIIVAISSLYELTAPSNISMWPLVQDGLIALIFLDVIFFVSLRTINKHMSLRIVLFLLCFISLATLTMNFVLVEIIPINKPLGSGLLALIQIIRN
jgi:hypothetical protein